MGMVDFFSIWKQWFGGRPKLSIPPVYEQVTATIWHPNSYRAERADLEFLSRSRICVATFWKLRQGTRLEMDLTFPQQFPATVRSIRLRTRVTQCKISRGRKRYRLWCDLTEPEDFMIKTIEHFFSWANGRS